jgi:pilus assembly protein CpaB
LKKRSGCIWIFAGVILAVLAGVLAFMAIMRAASTQVAPPVQEAPKVKVVVAARAMGVRELILESDVEVRSAPADIVPESAVRSLEEAVGWVTMTPLTAGEMVMATQLVSPTIKGEAVAYTMDKGKVAMAFPAEDLMSRNNLLQPGDHVDVLFSIAVNAADATTGDLVTFDALQNLEIAAVVQARDLETKTEAGVTAARPTAIVFALDPQDALVLKYLRDMGGMVDIVLRAPEVKERFSVQPVHMDYLSDRYQIRVPQAP